MRALEFGLLLFGPAVIALLALGGAALLWTRLARAAGGARVGLWILIGLLALIAFGIGGCYAALFVGGNL